MSPIRMPIAIALLLAALLLAACGSDDDTEDSARAEARKLTGQTRDLQEDVAATARALVEDLSANRTLARERLQDQERRARDLAATARKELPEGDPRTALVEANERTADAARDLRDFADTNRETTLERARAMLRQGEQKLRAAADDLIDRSPQDAREALEDARKNLPDIPLPAEPRP